MRDDVFDGAPGTNVRQSTTYAYVNPDPQTNALVRVRSPMGLRLGGANKHSSA